MGILKLITKNIITLRTLKTEHYEEQVRTLEVRTLQKIYTWNKKVYTS